MSIRRLDAARIACFAAALGFSAAHAQSADPRTESTESAGAAIASTLQPGGAQGDFDFQSDVVSSGPAAGGGTVVRVLVQLPVRDFLAVSRKDQAGLRLRLRVFAAADAFAALSAQSRSDAAERSQSERAEAEGADVAFERLMADFESVNPTAEAERQAQVIGNTDELLETDYRIFELSVEIPPGDYVFEILGENLSRRKPGLLDLLRNRPLAAVVRQLVRVPDLTRTPALADPAFLVGEERSAYAARLYGLLADSVHVRAALFGSGTFDLLVTATDRDGQLHWRDSVRVDVQGRRDREWSLSVNTLPAGQYVLQWVASGAGSGATVSRTFDVAWAIATWTRPRREHDTEADLVLRDTAFQTYRALPLGERERFMERFWASHDPSPESAVNELFDEFRRRVAYADLNFPETRRGALSDRGRVYVHFGPPDEVLVEAVPSHLAGRGAEEALEKVDDAYVASEHRRNEDPDGLGSIRGASAWDRSLRAQEHSRIVGPANEVISYELWRYVGGGAPLLPEDKGVAVDSGLRVLFVDTGGYGRYLLRKSSARLDIRGISANF